MRKPDAIDKQWFLKHFCHTENVDPILDFEEGLARGKYANVESRFKPGGKRQMPFNVTEQHIYEVVAGHKILNKPDGKQRILVVMPGPHRFMDCDDVHDRLQALGGFHEGTIWDLFALGAERDAYFFRNPVIASGTTFVLGYEEGGYPVEYVPYIYSRWNNRKCLKKIGFITKEPGWTGFSYLGAWQYPSK